MHHPLFDIGHSNHTLDALLATLRGEGVRCVVDVRRFPLSRRHPQFNLAPLQRALATLQIDYHHAPALGGRRSELTAPRWRNDGLTDAGLRGYADYAQTQPFHAAFAELLERARQQRTAMLCAEADVAHCHRRILADHAVSAGVAVVHLRVGAASVFAQRDPLAVIASDGTLHYPAPQRGLFD